MIRFTHKGDFNKAQKFLIRSKNMNYRRILEQYAREGVDILRSATPKDTGLAAESWKFEIITSRSGFTISWNNTNVEDGAPVVILLQYGHATRSGTFVEGRDFINPVMKPLFDKLTENLWKEVTSL